eukprot:scaffold138333_cov142-Phaeocystis_antarctica.AAC.1
MSAACCRAADAWSRAYTSTIPAHRRPRVDETRVRDERAALLESAVGRAHLIEQADWASQS